MPDVKIRIRDNGPLVIEGSIEVVDAEGNALVLPTDKPAHALCRCGASGNKPFCDGSHRSSGFESVIRAK
jgi:CDGSH-type Zn-finger protein